MAKYQILSINRPQGWEPAQLDDLPPAPGEPIEVLDEAEEVFEAVRRAIDRNQRTSPGATDRWAVVVERGGTGRIWPGVRVCTPLVYKVAAIWWPDGWEPSSPVDVPNCVRRMRGEMDDEALTYPRATAVARGLNEQSLSHAGVMWYVVVGVENEAISRTVSYDPSGSQTMVEVRRLHVIRPEQGGGKGDCSHCPAHSFPCAEEDWTSLEQTVTGGEGRTVAE